MGETSALGSGHDLGVLGIELNRESTSPSALPLLMLFPSLK